MVCVSIRHSLKHKQGRRAAWPPMMSTAAGLYNKSSERPAIVTQRSSHADYALPSGTAGGETSGSSTTVCHFSGRFDLTAGWHVCPWVRVFAPHLQIERWQQGSMCSVPGKCVPRTFQELFSVRCRKRLRNKEVRSQSWQGCIGGEVFHSFRVYMCFLVAFSFQNHT